VDIVAALRARMAPYGGTRKAWHVGVWPCVTLAERTALRRIQALAITGKRVCGTASNREKQMTSDTNRLVRPGVAAQRSAQRKRPQASIAKLPDERKVCAHDASFSIERRESPTRDILSKARAV
jgi:hypothetical protein